MSRTARGQVQGLDDVLKGHRPVQVQVRRSRQRSCSVNLKSRYTVTIPLRFTVASCKSTMILNPHWLLIIAKPEFCQWSDNYTFTESMMIAADPTRMIWTPDHDHRILTPAPGPSGEVRALRLTSCTASCKCGETKHLNYESSSL